jgi:hypothetical protein
LIITFGGVSSASADPSQRIIGDIFNFVQHKIEKKRHKREMDRRPEATYSVGGMRVGEIAHLGPNYSCDQLPSDPSYVTCSATDRRTVDRGPFTQRTTVITDADGRVVYVDRLLSPAFFRPGEMAGDIDDLSRTFGSPPRVSERAIGRGHAVIATWGNISLDALGTKAAQEPESWLITDFMNNLRESYRYHLPLFRPAGGPGFVWIAYDKGYGVGRLRFFTTDPSLLPDIAKPPPAHVAEGVSAEAEEEPPEFRDSKTFDVPSSASEAQRFEQSPEVTQAQNVAVPAEATPTVQHQGTPGETWHAPPATSAPIPVQAEVVAAAPAPVQMSREGGTDTRANQLLTLLAWASVAGMIALTVAGATKKVVIFNDSTDLAVSFTPFLLPLVTLYLLGSIAPESCTTVEGQTHCRTDVWGAVAGGDIVVMLVFALATVFYAACIFRIFAVSIAANGLPLGLAVGGFKVIASSLLGFVIVIAGYGYFASKNSRDSMKAALLGGLAAWLLKSLVNGPEVLARRHPATP